MKQKTIYLKASGILFLMLFLFSTSAFGQTITVKGTVKDATNATLPGVNVRVQGSSSGTITDIDGKFSIQVPSNAKLEFSFVGYSSQVIGINGKTVVNVTLSEDTKALSEVVVVGYGVQRKEAVTGSVASVKGDLIREVPAGNITNALQGRIAGVEMTQTNSKPGATMQIRIRGTRSLNASNDPLVVLDGIPFAGSISDINPSDIKSIDILKDASATAIYGARGANGVIMVTTNKGNMGQQARVTYDAYVGAATLFARYPMMNGDELYQVRKIAGKFPGAVAGEPGLGSDEVKGQNTDWQDLMYKTGMVMNHSLGISGGTEKGSYNVGAGYFKQTSLLPGQDYKRISIRASLDQQIGKHLRFGLTSNSNYSLTNGQNLNLTNVLSLSPMINPYNTDGSWKARVDAVQDSKSWAYSRDAINALGDNWADNQKSYGTYNSLYGEIKIPGIEGLSYRMNLGLNLLMANRGQFQGVGVFNTAADASSNGSLSKSTTTNWVVENIVSYDKTFNKHHINLTGLYSSEETQYDRSMVEAKNIPASFFSYYNLGRAPSDQVTVNPDNQTYELYALKSMMGRVMYDYDGRYMLSVSVRSDGSSRLAPGHKWHTYPAVSAGWNISKESFMKNVSWVDNLKLRFGWGQTSNQSISPYATLGRLSTRPYNFGTLKSTALLVSESPNPTLGWEYSITYNTGLEFNLLKNRLWGSVEYYVVDTKDLLMKVNLPTTAGISSQWANVGKSQNKGVELALNGSIINNKNGWTWEVGVNFYTNKNKIVSLQSGQSKDDANWWFVGQPINVIYDYKKIGIWQQNDPNLSILEPDGNVGMIKVKYTGAYNADGTPVRKIGSDDRQVIKVDPDYMGGFNTRVAYKNLDLSLIGTYQHGGTLISNLHSASGYLNLLTGRRGEVKVDYWTPDNTDAKYPKPGGVQSGDNPKYGSTLGYFSGSYLKVSTITLGYNLDPKMKFIKDLGISKFRLYVTVQNAFVLFSPFTNETKLDPVPNSYVNENSAVTTGYNNTKLLSVGCNTPQTRNFVFGLNVSF